MREIQPGMAFHKDNAYTKFWVYKREGQWYLIYPFRYPLLHDAGRRITVESVREAYDEMDQALAALPE